MGVADHLPGTRAAAVGEGTIRRSSPTSAWLPIVYGCDKTCTYCIVPFSRGPERSRPFDEIVAEARALAAAGYREVTLLGQNVNSYGHDLPAEARFDHIDTERWSGRRLDLHARPDLAELHPRDRRPPDVRRPAAIPRLRFVTSHPWDLSDRLIAAMADCPRVCAAPPPAGPVGRRRGAPPDGPPVHGRALPGAAGPVREAVPGIAISTDVIVGFCGETEAQFEATLRCSSRPLRPGLRGGLLERPGHAGDAPPRRRAGGREARRLNALLASRRGSGWSATGRGSAATVEVLVDAVVPPRSHDHDHEEARRGAAAVATRRPADGVHLAGRSRENKLVHLAGPATLLGSLVTVRVDHAGPYALRGALAWARRDGGASARTEQRPPLLVIAGATATGKTGLAIDVADALIAGEAGRPRSSRPTRARSSAASTSGRPRSSAGRAARIPHHGLDLVEPDEPFSVADFAAHAQQALAEIAARGGLAILVGGTGLYLRAVARGLTRDALPSDADERRPARGGAGARWRRGARRAPAGRRSERSPRSTICATPVASSGRSRSASSRGGGPLPAPLGYAGPVAWIGLDRRPRRRTADCIATRARAQFDDGLIEEAAALRERFDPGLPAFSAIGYAEAWAVLDGELTREAAIERDAPERGVREAPANMVPGRARGRMARRDGGSGRTGAGRRAAAAADETPSAPEAEHAAVAACRRSRRPGSTGPRRSRLAGPRWQVAPAADDRR